MKKHSGRRSFLKKMGAGSIGAGVLPGALLSNGTPGVQSRRDTGNPSKRSRLPERAYNSKYEGEYLSRVAFPIGGLGAGMFCLEGTGAISHMSVRHQPDVFNEPGVFGALYVKTGETTTAKIVEGPVPDWKRFGQPNSGNGSGGTIFGLPRFENVSFETRFPFGTVSLEDAEVPLKATIEGWSPFVPTDADNSALPAGALVYTFSNRGKTSVDAVFSFHARNFIKHKEGGTDRILPFENGFILAQEGTEEKPFLEGSFAIFCDQENAIVDHCWFRGGWFDPLTITWENIRGGKANPVEPVESGAPGASLFVPFSLPPGEKKTIKVFTSWYVPVTDLRYGDDGPPDQCTGAACCSSSGELGATVANPEYATGKYKPWYSNRFKDIGAIANYWKTNYEELEKNTRAFTGAFYSSTLPAEVIEAVAANLTILKSPTVMREYDGRLWSFEGCGDTWGCCHGSCTHVWNYAQAIPHLFPALERTLRHTEFCESQNDAGHQTFRANLPIRPPKHDFHAAADGQLGGIMKLHREWRISGDGEWLATMYPLAKASLDYCIRTWDPRHKGVIEEPHHNTYDIEFWGPDGMCTGFYLGALKAMVSMAEFLGKKEDIAHYTKLYDSGRDFLERELYNGEYFYQKIQVEGLNAPSPLEAAQKTMVGKYSDEAQALLRKEGPKYQYGTGCLSDGVLGAWIARMCGLEDPFDRTKIQSHLQAVYRYNLKHDLSDHANPQRPSYALGDEGGLLLCSWPRGGKLSLPFVYSDEVWTGIEYQVAAHLMLMNRVGEGLDIVRTCRSRYDGRRRNPFNEYECGHWYARALASYGMLEGLTGVRFDAVSKTLYIDSRVGDFTTFLSTETGFGTVHLAAGRPSLRVAYGTIPVEHTVVSGKNVPLTRS